MVPAERKLLSDEVMVLVVRTCLLKSVIVPILTMLLSFFLLYFSYIFAFMDASSFSNLTSSFFNASYKSPILQLIYFIKISYLPYKSLSLDIPSSLMIFSLAFISSYFYYMVAAIYFSFAKLSSYF